jgi:hypothetical protein
VLQSGVDLPYRAIKTNIGNSADAPRVAVVNEQFAKHYWPNADPVGKHIRLGNAAGLPVEIVGVVRTIKYTDTRERPMDFLYMPLAQHPLSRMTLMLRSTGDPLQLIPPLKDIVRAFDANLPMFQTRAFEDLYVDMAVRGPQIAVDLVGTMGAAGLLLTIAGLMSYNVSRRTREIGIRVALGAGQSSVLRLVMGRGLVLVGIGTIFGLMMGLGVEQAMNAMLFDAGRVDVLTLWRKLTRFLEYPELELSNNLAEYSMRPVALGRKNWIHIGSPQAGPKVAAILSVVESCRRLKLSVRDYLAAILPGLADLPIRRLPELTPKAWVCSSWSRPFVSFPVGRGLVSPCSLTVSSRGESSLESADRSGGDHNPDPGVWKA